MSRGGCLGLLLLASAGAAGTPPGLPPPAQAFDADFTESRTLPGFKQPLVSHGQVSFRRPGKVRWEVTQPYHYLFTMDDQGMQETLPDGAVRKMDVEHAPWLAAIQRIFLGALAGDAEALQQYFTVDVTAEAGGRRLELTPKPGPMAQAIRRISVESGAAPEDIRIDEQAGGEIHIQFLNARVQAATP